MIDSDMSRANMQTGSNIRGGDGVSRDDMFAWIDLYRDRAWKAEATVTRLRELLRRLEGKMHLCLICHGHFEWIGDERPPMVGHADSCELAKELADD